MQSGQPWVQSQPGCAEGPKSCCSQAPAALQLGHFGLPKAPAHPSSHSNCTRPLLQLHCAPPEGRGVKRPEPSNGQTCQRSEAKQEMLAVGGMGTQGELQQLYHGSVPPNQSSGKKQPSQSRRHGAELPVPLRNASREAGKQQGAALLHTGLSLTQPGRGEHSCCSAAPTAACPAPGCGAGRKPSPPAGKHGAEPTSPGSSPSPITPAQCLGAAPPVLGQHSPPEHGAQGAAAEPTILQGRASPHLTSVH